MSNLTYHSTSDYTIDSREVADMVGKRHDNLLRNIDKYITILTGSNLSSLELTTSKLRALEFFRKAGYFDEKGEKRPCYLITRKGCDLIAHKMTGEKGVLFTAAYITRFEEMEKALKPTTALAALEQTVVVLRQHDERINELSDRVDNQITVTYTQAAAIQKAVASRVIDLLGGKGSDNYKQNRCTYFAQLHRDIKDRLGVPSYRDIRKLDYKAALDYVRVWLPKKVAV